MSKRILLSVLALVFLAISAQPAAAQFKKAKDVRNHLKKHDYRVTKEDEYLRAKHDDWLNMTVRGYKGGLLLRAWLETSRQDTDDLETLANVLNYKATATRIYIDDENDLIYETWFPGEYDKGRFEALLDAWHEDTIGQSDAVQSHLDL